MRSRRCARRRCRHEPACRRSAMAGRRRARDRGRGGGPPRLGAARGGHAHAGVAFGRARHDRRRPPRAAGDRTRAAPAARRALAARTAARARAHARPVLRRRADAALCAAHRQSTRHLDPARAALRAAALRRRPRRARDRAAARGHPLPCELDRCARGRVSAPAERAAHRAHLQRAGRGRGRERAIGRVLPRADAQPRAGPGGHRGHLEARRLRLPRPDRLQDQTRAFSASLRGARHRARRAVAPDLPDRRAGHRRQGARGDRGRRGGAAARVGVAPGAACRPPRWRHPDS